MKPPYPRRSVPDLPKRVPGSARSVGPGAGPDPDRAPDRVGPAADAADSRAPLPRLTQFSSLGSRGNAGRGGAAPPPTAGIRGPESAGDRFDAGFARRGEAAESPTGGRVIPLATARRRLGDRSGRAGSRGALAVVGIVGLLATGSVLLTLGVIARDAGASHDGTSVTVDSADHGNNVLDGLAVPSAGPSGTTAGKQRDGSEKPAPSASPSVSASGKASASPGAHAEASATATAKDGSAARTVAAGVGVFSHASHRCIDIVGGKAVSGAGLMIWDCSQSTSQRWTFTGGTMRALGMCVQLAGGSAADGTDLVVAPCNGGADQRFVLNSSHDLTSGLDNKCADVRDNQTANGTRLQVWSCAGSPNQKWSKS